VEWMPTTRRPGNSSARIRAPPVLRIVEGGHEHGRVPDVKVRVSSRQALAGEHDGRGHGQANDVQFPTLASRARASRAAALFSTAKFGSLRFFSSARTTLPGATKRAKSSMWPGCVVARNAALQPEHALGAQVIPQYGFHSALPSARFRAWRPSSKHSSVREQRPFAVDVDGAAFQHHARAFAPDLRLW